MHAGVAMHECTWSKYDITMDHTFSWATEFRATEFAIYCGISVIQLQNLI